MQQKLTLNEDEKTSEKPKMRTSRESLTLDENEARLINLEEVYQQWKGQFEKIKVPKVNKSNTPGKKNKNVQELLAEGKIDGWETAK